MKLLDNIDVWESCFQLNIDPADHKDPGLDATFCLNSQDNGTGELDKGLLTHVISEWKVFGMQKLFLIFFFQGRFLNKMSSSEDYENNKY